MEVLTAQAYGITLYKQSEKTHDGEVDGKKVQIKGDTRERIDCYPRKTGIFAGRIFR